MREFLPSCVLDLGILHSPGCLLWSITVSPLSLAGIASWNIHSAGNSSGLGFPTPPSCRCQRLCVGSDGILRRRLLSQLGLMFLCSWILGLGGLCRPPGGSFSQLGLSPGCPMLRPRPPPLRAVTSVVWFSAQLRNSELRCLVCSPRWSPQGPAPARCSSPGGEARAYAQASEPRRLYGTPSPRGLLIRTTTVSTPELAGFLVTPGGLP